MRGVTRPLYSALLALSAALLASALALAATPDQVAAIDRMFAEAYPASGPGAAVLIVQDGKPVLRKGYGMAELELGVPIAPDMVFRVGSVTKEFTAACVLRLVEEGRLALDDSVEKYLPDFPTGGRRVTIAQLLTHTSGIRSYTDMPGWFGPRMREDRSPREIEALFDGEPFDFEPGTNWHYDNSGYVLLGEILEKVTGKPYADLVAETIFRPLGMNDTRYGSDAPIVPKRAAGYVKTPNGVVNAPFLSMTQPYAAGALVSTVDDLARWHRALDAGTVLTAESRRRMWTPVRLPDGRDTHYGYGWIVWSDGGRPVVEHGGGINGFVTANLRLPEDRIYVAVLSNCAGCADVRGLALRAATRLAGRPWDERPAAAVVPERLDRLAGTYRDADGDDWIVTRQSDHLVLAAGPTRDDAWPSSETQFFSRDRVRTLRFVLAPDGSVAGMEIDEKAGPAETARRVATPVEGPPRVSAQRHRRPDVRHLRGKLLLELGQRRLDGFPPGRVEERHGQPPADQGGRLDLARERLPHDAAPAGLQPGERAVAARDLPEHPGRRGVERDEGAPPHREGFSGGAGRSGFSPVNTRRTSSTTIRAISRRVSTVALPAWGISTTRSSSSRAGVIAGSFS